jgi:hypothetical protein
MNDYPNQQSSPSPGYLAGRASDGGGNKWPDMEPFLQSFLREPPLNGYYQPSESSQGPQQIASLTDAILHHDEWRFDGSEYAGQFAWYPQPVAPGGAIDPGVLISPSGHQDNPVQHSQYDEQYFNIGGQFDRLADLSAPRDAGEGVQSHRGTVNNEAYSLNLNFDVERDLNVGTRGYLGNSHGTNHVDDGTRILGGLSMSAVLGRSPMQGTCNAVPKIVVDSQHLHTLALDHRHDSGAVPPSPRSVISGDSLRCPHSGCTSEFHGTYRRGNLARHCRLKHKGKIVHYKCEAEACMSVFKRQDARLKHYRKHHPGLAKRRVLLQAPSVSTETGSVREYLDSPQQTYSMSLCDSQSIDDAEKPAFSAGNDSEYQYNP